MAKQILTSRAGLWGLAVLVVVGAVAIGVLATRPAPAVTAINMDDDQIAIRGYDTVAYFTEGKATKGSSEFEHTWEGARWHFTSDEHRDLFVGDPERYAPRYGGYCSMGLAIGEYSDADPEVWTIVEGKLYLNKNEKVREMWSKGPDAYIAASEHNWNNYRDELRINENLQ